MEWKTHSWEGQSLGGEGQPEDHVSQNLHDSPDTLVKFMQILTQKWVRPETLHFSQLLADTDGMLP